jgi:hypothetical protein
LILKEESMSSMENLNIAIKLREAGKLEEAKTLLLIRSIMGLRDL